MDLMAYAQIENLEEIAKGNGIEVPRLRGYRLMSEEKLVSDEELREMLKDAEFRAAEDWCEAEPRFSMDPYCYSFCSSTDRVKEKYLISEVQEWECGPHRETVGIRWDKIHGKKRKVLKYGIKRAQKAIKDNISVWNRYAGKPGILYIHARIGGNNWAYFGGDDLEKKTWFIEKVDDWFDSTYCDIYARISTGGEEDGRLECI